jgi:hypothetical protein
MVIKETSQEIELIRAFLERATELVDGQNERISIEAFCRFARGRLSYIAKKDRAKIRRSGAPRKYDHRGLATHYIAWRKRYPDRRQHPDNEYFRQHMNAGTDEDCRRCRTALNNALKEHALTERQGTKPK